MTLYPEQALTVAALPIHDDYADLLSYRQSFLQSSVDSSLTDQSRARRDARSGCHHAPRVSRGVKTPGLAAPREGSARD